MLVSKRGVPLHPLAAEQEVVHFGVFRLDKSCYFKGLKVANEEQDYRTGVFHQVAQHPVDQVY